MQLDLFNETLQKKIDRVERWVLRLNRELDFLKEVVNLSNKKTDHSCKSKNAGKQIDFFGT